jgi:hypothetical protein
LLDSGASNHFTPLITDLVSYKRFPEKETVWTAGPPIELLGIGTALLEYEIEIKGKNTKKVLRLESVLHVPWITSRILSLGSFLKEGMRVYGDAAAMTLSLPGKKIPVMRCFPLNTGNGTIYFLKAQPALRSSLHSVFKEDFETMHR